MPFNPKQEKFLHSIPAMPGIRQHAVGGIPPVQPIHQMPAIQPPTAIQKPHAPRWGKIQQYLSQPSAPAVPEEKE